MHESLIGIYTDRFSEMENVRQIVSINEFRSLSPGKRSISEATMPYNDKLEYWLFSPHSGLYFKRKFVPTVALLVQIKQGCVFMIINEEHEYDQKAGMSVIGQKYKINNIGYYKHYIPLVELVLSLEKEENKDVKSEVDIAILKDKIKNLARL